jgi:hypothetical protein
MEARYPEFAASGGELAGNFNLSSKNNDRIWITSCHVVARALL